MSGIEVAGLVLGAVPILIEAIDRYRSGINKVKSGFKKRKVIERLGRALRFQKSIVEAITRNVLIQSGCEHAVGADPGQLRTLLQDKLTQDTVVDFLGTDNARVFSDALVDCMTDVSRATTSLASLIPALAPVKNHTDVQAVLDANAATEKAQLQVFARLSLVFSFESLEGEIEALDRSTNLLDKFARNVTVNHQPGQNVPSRKAAKLAKALQVVRRNAVNLHSALTRQWVMPCHKRHELKVFLEDRIIEPKPRQTMSDARASCFKVVFVGGATHPTDFWHETLFHIEAEDFQDAGTPTSKGPRIQFSTPQLQPAKSKHNVQDICAAITGAICTARHPMFHLAGTKDIAMTLHTQSAVTTQSFQSSSVTLQKILQDHHGQNSPPLALPWKLRMILALNVASSFLQFIRTPWAQPSWSASNIYISQAADGQKVDLRRPFLSSDFVSHPPQPTNQSAQVKEDLLELGILLLEIWHETNLETQFAQQLSASNVSFMRRACAIQWLDDLQNPLSDHYYRAASYCVSGQIIPDPRASEWDDPDIWKSVCENVIDPLSKVAQI